MKTPVKSFNGYLLRPVEKLFLSTNGENFIKDWEGFEPFPYEDIAGHCTIGYGEKLHDGKCTVGDHAKYPNGMSHADASQALSSSVAESVRNVRKWLKGSMVSQAMFDALVSLTFNTGGNRGQWQVYKLTATGKFREAAVEFLNINLAENPNTGKKEPSPGLTKRRQAENNMYLNAVYSKP